MTAAQIMEAEHRLIESVVKALGGAAAAIEKGQHPDSHLLITAAEFLRTYADKLHHGKEEALFFPMLVKRGVPPQGCTSANFSRSSRWSTSVRTLSAMGKTIASSFQMWFW